MSDAVKIPCDDPTCTICHSTEPLCVATEMIGGIGWSRGKEHACPREATQGKYCDYHAWLFGEPSE